MKKLIIVSALFMSMQAHASTESICAAVADYAVTVAEGSKLGMPFDGVKARFLKRQKVESETELDNYYRAVLEVLTQASYVWSSLDASTVRSLAFSTCMVKVPK